MKLRMLLVTALSSVLLLVSGMSFSEDAERAQENIQTQQQMHGSQLMTEQERAEHRARMRAAQSDEERKQIRKEQHEKMKARAKELGVTIPDEPPATGQGMGSGGGSQGR